MRVLICYEIFTQIKGTSTPFTFRFPEVVSGELEETMQPDGDQKVFLYIVVTAIIEVFLMAIVVVCIVMALWYCFSKRNKTPNGVSKKNADVEMTEKNCV